MPELNVSAAAPAFDVLISGATVIDGSGAPGRRADVALRGDRIAAIAPTLQATAAQHIDGTGRVLAPGFIDAHTHDDMALVDAALMRPKLLQGVTTVIAGNCGISAAPWSRPGRPPPPLDLLDRGRLPTAGFAEYMAALAAAPAQLNAALLLGLTTVRAQVMDDPMRAAATAQIDRMQAHVAEALAAGALGVSIGPYYPPARAASADEIVAACAPLQGQPAVLTVHLRDEADAIVPALDEAIDIATRLRVPLVISHHKLLGTRNHGRSAQTLRRIEKAAQRTPVCLDCYPYTASSTMLDPAKVDGATRVRVAWSQPQPAQAGRDLDEIASGWQCSRQDAARRLTPGGAIYFAMARDDVRAIARHPLTMIGSDGLPHDAAPHPRLWGTFPRVLGPLVREQGWFTLEEAVHKMTGLPAQRFGLTGRGRIAVGAQADLVLFDPARIADRATYADPRQPPVGIDGVIVNGRLRVWAGELVGAANGTLCASGAASSAAPT
jgi:N-acyl-D-amino-acid deacylase